jgi:translocation and assembly module TamB
VDYTRNGVAMDVRLQQTPTAWITAKGIAPLTLFRTTPPGVDAHDEARAGGVVDIQIASSPIELGIIQGFTPYVTNVTGTLQANVHVTGTGYDPHPDGAIEIRGGAFAIPELGTRYSGLDTRVDFKPDVVTVRDFKILDSRGFPMTIGGTLAVHEGSVGAVNITLESQAFEVIDNRVADVKLNARLKLTGQLREPRLEGTVDVENATIHLAELIEQTTANPYSTEATDDGLVGADEAARATPPTPEKSAKQDQPTLFSALDLDVTVAVPDNMVLRGNDLRPANAPIDIGDMNATVGGELRVRKAPAGDLSLVGDVNTVRGNYTFQGRRFDILGDGHVRFDGTDELNPVLNIRARRIISGVETFVRVQGTLKQPELSFSSNPPLDQADILSLIVFNQPINELGEGQQVSLTERATALAGGYLATGLSRSISNALELDEFELLAGERGFGPTLSVGEQVGEHFFFRIKQGFGDAQATELILEYRLKEQLRVQATTAQTPSTERVTFRRIERAGLDLLFFFSY